MRGGGEYGLLTIEIAASLAAHHMPVTPDERDELRALLEAMNMPTDPIDQLNVQAWFSTSTRRWTNPMIRTFVSSGRVQVRAAASADGATVHAGLFARCPCFSPGARAERVRPRAPTGWLSVCLTD